MASSDEKRSDNEKEKGEDLSCALTKLYRLAYESMYDEYDTNNLQKDYQLISTEFTEILPSKQYSSPSSSSKLLDIITNLVSTAKDTNIYGKKDSNIEAKEAKIALIEYCVADNIDQALIYILKYKLEHKSATDIINYVHSKSEGWSSYSYAAIHKVLSKLSRSEGGFRNNDDIMKRFGIEKVPWGKPEEERKKVKELNAPKERKRDEYIKNVIKSKYERTLLLIEILLREKASTTLKSNASGWRVAAKNETVFNQALATNKMDVLRAIFKYGIDIDIDTTCTSGGSSMRTDSSQSWKPIHTAIRTCNYELTKLIIRRGANINCYRTYRMSNEYGSRQNEQHTALYVICSKLKDENKMLKLILQTHEQKHNGIPDVNKFNCFITNESKPKDVYKQQKRDAKRRERQQGDEDADKDSSDKPQENDDDEDEEDDGGWDDPRSGFYINPYINMNNYETTLHVAIRRCDVEMIKLLLIYGADTSLCNVKSPKGYGGHSSWYRSREEELDRSVLMRKWYDAFIENYRKTGVLEQYESVKDVYKILEEVKGDDKVKAQIKKIFDDKSIMFPEMLDFYPNNMGKALQNIIETLSNTLPIVLINIIIEYFYNIVEQTVKEADKEVDISNIKQ